MKTIRLCLCLCVLGCVNSLFAQEETEGNGMLFPRFESGSVVFKGGTRTSALLNYSMIQQEMLFINVDSTVLALANLSEILAVVINNRRFVPASSDGIFYEEKEAGVNSFFVQRKAIFLSEGKAAGYGGYSTTSAITSVKTLYNGTGRVQDLHLDEKFKMKVEYYYYLKSGNSYKKFFSVKTLGKLFKGQEAKIEEFAKEQSINFSKTEDVARIVEYGYSLTK